MAKRRSVQQFRNDYAELVRRAKLGEFKAYMDAYHPELPVHARNLAEDKFKRDVAEELRRSGRFPE